MSISRLTYNENCWDSGLIDELKTIAREAIDLHGSYIKDTKVKALVFYKDDHRIKMSNNRVIHNPIFKEICPLFRNTQCQINVMVSSKRSKAIHGFIYQYVHGEWIRDNTIETMESGAYGNNFGE